MPDPEERYYNINRLNILFAAAAVVLLLSIVLMFADDYVREWKNYQAKFRALEIEKTRVKYDLEHNNLQKSPEYQALTAQIEEAKKIIAEKCSSLTDVRSRIVRLQAENDLITHNYKIKIAQLDAARFRYEEAIDKKHDAVRVEQDYQKIKNEVADLKAGVEQSDAKIRAEQKSLDDCEGRAKDLARQEMAMEKQLALFQRKLRKIDPEAMNLPTFFADLIRDLPILDLANPKYKLEQVVLKDLTDDVNFLQVPKAERCITCHLGIANPDYTNAPQPFTAHPDLELYVGNNSKHPLEDFGCTTCHGGRGRGTDFVSSSHTPSTKEQEHEWKKKYNWSENHYWETPMYPLKFVEAGCFKCHSNESTIKGAEKLNLGLQLIERSGCYTCHTIDRYKDWPRSGPDLTQIASKVTKEWTYGWIKDPRSFRHNTSMPSFFQQSNTSDPASVARGDQEIHAIVHYLFGKSKDYKLNSMPHWGDEKKGEEIVASLGCLGCHNIQQSPSTVKRTAQSLRREHGPNLIGLGTKTTKVWLYNWLKDPNRYHPQTRMPNLRLSDQEAADAAAFLTEDKNSTFASHSIPAVNEEIVTTIARDLMVKTNTLAQAEAKLAAMNLDDKLAFAGEKLITHYGCFACHNIAGFENSKPIGTDLTEEGSKSIHNLDFGFIDIEHSKDAWFVQKLKDPRIFDRDKIKAPDEKLRMPNFHFTEEEAEAITTALLGFVKDKPPVSKLKPRTPENLYHEKGQMIVKQFNCQGCHVMEGEGGAIQPSVTQWLMNSTGRDENEANTVTNSFSPPNLIGEGKKVKSEWLFEFLHEPTTIRPWLSVRMPTYKFNGAHLNALVKYFSAVDKEPFPFAEMVDAQLSKEEFVQAEKLFSTDYFGCAKCHIVGEKMPDGSAENWAPDFGLAKKRLKPGWIADWIKDPQKLLPGTKMPNYFDPQAFDASGPEDLFGGDEHRQIEALRNYILTISTPAPAPDKKGTEIKKPAEAPAAEKTAPEPAKADMPAAVSN